MSVEIGEGVGAIWIVFAIEHDHSGPPEFLAAYDGERAKECAIALVNVIKRAGCYREVLPTLVPLWPAITAQAPTVSQAQLRDEVVASFKATNSFIRGEK